MQKTYLMSAFHIDGFNRMKLEKLLVVEPGIDVVHVYKSLHGTRSFLVLGGDNSPIGTKFEYIKDTGMGHGYVPREDSVLFVANRIQVKNGVVVSSINEEGMTKAHSVKVFK